MAGSPDSSPETRALQHFDSVVAQLTAPNPDIISAARACQHACEILTWPAKDWFDRELEGYAQGAELPWYRKDYQGTIEWVMDAEPSILGRHQYVPVIPAPRAMPYEIRMPLALLLDWWESGLRERTGQVRQVLHPADNHIHSIHEERAFPALHFRRALAQIEHEVFRFASAAVKLLRFGSAIRNVFETYRALLDRRLSEMGLSHQWEAIERGLTSSNPQEWRQVLWSCRVCYETWQPTSGVTSAQHTFIYQAKATTESW